MPLAPIAALALAAALAAPAAAAEVAPAAPPGERALPARDDGIARLRFAWPAPLHARVAVRRTRSGGGAPATSFTATYEARVEEEDGGLSLSSRGAAWRGDLPFPRDAEPEARRATERIVQRVGRDGRFGGLEGVEALRPVLQRALAAAEVPEEDAARALPLAERALRADAEELWNLAVGFWAGADLRIGERYALVSEAEIPLAPGVRAPHAVEFGVRRRVPCSAAEGGTRCVEATLRATPEPAALARSAAALRERLGIAGAAARAAEELSAEGELVLVTEPETLLPRRVVWTRALRLAAPGAAAELVDRVEYDYRYPAREAAARARRRAPAGAGPEAAPIDRSRVPADAG